MNTSWCVGLTLVVCWPLLAFTRQTTAPAAHPAQAETAPEKAPALTSLTAPAPSTGEGRIKLDVVVTDESGKPVTGLGLKDFTLLDHNHPSKILSFRAVDGSVEMTDSPVEIILLLDTVNMSIQQVAFVHQEMDKFLRQNGGHLAQPVSIFVLTNTGVVDGESQPSTDGNALADGIKDLDDRSSTIGQSAGVWGAIESYQFSIQMLAAIAEREAEKPGKKLLIWAGPGWPLPDSPNIEITSMEQNAIFDEIVELSTRLREARITVYNIASGIPGRSTNVYRDFLKGVKTAKNATPFNLGLKVLAVQSGGRVLGPDNNLTAQIEGCVQDATAYYTLSFDPPRADRANEYHDLKVLIGQPKLKARTNIGYYNQPDILRKPLVAGPAVPVLRTDPKKTKASNKSVTVEEVEDVLKAAVLKMPDDEIAQQLSGLVLTERMNSLRLSFWKAKLPGPKSWQALVALADASSFLNLPAEEVPGLTPPDLATQQAILSRTSEYLSKTVPKLPDIFATRRMVRYDVIGQVGTAVSAAHPWLVLDSSSATVTYRHGHEVVDSAAGKSKELIARDQGLEIRGTFGPILYETFLDATHSYLAWSHWEKGTSGPLAVFRFAVPKGNSEYLLDFPDPFVVYGIRDIQKLTAYHGEFAVDPATGFILRITVEADPDRSIPLVRADIMVEYGPVDIAGKTYICPLRSVSLTKMESSSRPNSIFLNDAVFGEYHVFRSESRVLTDSIP